MCVEKSEGKNVPETELRQKILYFFHSNFPKGMYEIYNILANRLYLFS